MKAHEYWFSHYGVRRNPGIFFYVFCTSKNNFKKFLKSCPILSLPIQSICSFFLFRSSASFSLRFSSRLSSNITAALFKNSFFHTDFSISDSL